MRPRLISLSSLRNGLLKPRFGSRRGGAPCARPACRRVRIVSSLGPRLLRTPASLLLDHADEMANFGDHAAGHRGVGQFLHPPDLVQAEADESLALNVVTPRR